MATLYLCTPRGSRVGEDHVAIKVVHQHLAEDERFLKMFIDEAVLSSRIQHPNVVHVQELGEVGSTYFLVMEYVHGCTLSQLLRSLALNRRRMRPELAVRIAIAVADGLHAGHEARGPDGSLLGVVHRDVTPENILITKKGDIKVIDFGVAKSKDRVAQTTAGGMIKGKFSYMAPEQAKDGDLDRRTDVYQLGIVLWEMLTMRRCFKGEMSREFLEVLRNPTIIPPKEHVPTISEELNAVVMKSMAVDISARIETANAFRRMLAKAEPTALSMGRMQLSELLSTLLSDELKELELNLPSEFTPVAEDVHAFDEEEALKTLTIEASGLSSGGDMLSTGAKELAGGVFDRGSEAPVKVADDTGKQRLNTAFGLNAPSPFEVDIAADISGEFDVEEDATVIKQPDLSVFKALGIEFGGGKEKRAGFGTEPPKNESKHPVPLRALFAEPPARPVTKEAVRPAPQYRDEASFSAKVEDFVQSKGMWLATTALVVVGVLYWFFG